VEIDRQDGEDLRRRGLCEQLGLGDRLRVGIEREMGEGGGDVGERGLLGG
jgi:hypothetical protein